ncbi:GntR family transcriptional regulator [Flavivirga algicola]|uniref:GntR family transcriptional regulator n=1 Tax=Flavivirga algicola TaxID=2729136 RepID=A0ABX1RY43_9FLAO|nr:GntR family transcriptional regulator [Flavivirga algicola]NMH87968.1 GntR family transcriptional regulator [Flavivirga algicola]
MEVKTPLYHKVYTYLLDKIKKDYQPGDLLPTQSEIATATETSLITVKRAIKELETDGYLESKPGKGTIIRRPQIIDNHIGVSSWTDSITSQGSVPSTKWVKIKQKAPIATIANSLELKAREKAVTVERLRLIENKPICLMTNHIAARLAPGLNKDTSIGESLYTYLKDQYNLIGILAEEQVYAREATIYEKKTLQLKTPIVLVIERLSFLANKTPFEFSSIIAAADSYVYRSKQINKTVDSKTLNDLLKTESKY